jgi:predicted ATPase
MGERNIRDCGNNSNFTDQIKTYLHNCFSFSSRRFLTMPELASDFQTLPPEYQAVLHLVQETHKIAVTPLQLLVGGWSGAVVYLVSLSSKATNLIEHCILKLDRKGKAARSDEIARHNAVMSKSTPEFARAHIAELVFDRVEQDEAIAIFYRIAGQSLLKYLPLSKYERQSQLQTIFIKTHQVLLQEWNADALFLQAVHPQKVLEKWLGFRLAAGGNTERFLQETCHVNPDVPGFLINGHVFPNPLLHARQAEPWGKCRALDVATGFIHGDLNTNNILVRFADDRETLAGYYLIDFALYKEGMPLLYDQRYLEMSYLMQALSQVSFGKSVGFLTLLAVADTPDPHRVPIEMSGVSAVIAAARSVFATWVNENHPSLHDDLWGQYWLAGAAAGLAYCHKAGQTDQARLAGLIYAATNLKRYAATFHLPLPTHVELLYDDSQFESDSPGTQRSKKSRHNLPVQPTPFIGRSEQIAALKELLLRPDVRLVTLIGPGGTGKTRLSLQVAQEILDHFPQGVFFVPLADDTDGNQFISRLAQQLAVREGGRPMLENVKDYLRGKGLLLVLDNFEQLISAASVVAELLAAASQLKIITSSRIALNLQGEHTFAVPPLDLPQSTSGLKLEDLLENEAVLLFIGRAQAVQSNFKLTDENASAVAEICRHLDGLPLALELAAARIKLLPPTAILARLDDRLKLLTGGARDLPTRHQALRNTLEWSYGLLNEKEKALYAQLSVFVGGFSFEAAEAVCNPDGKSDILEGLTSLVNNSLLRQEVTAAGEPRFGMLETIRAYALEQLRDRGELAVLQARHARYYGEIVSNQAGQQIYSANALPWLNWLERELDNIRATLSWCVSNPEGIELGAMLVWVLMWFCYRRGYLSEGRVWTQRILASPVLQEDSRHKAMVLSSDGFLSMWQGEQELALGQLQKGLAIVQRLEDEQMMPLLLMGNGVVLINMGRDSLAKSLFDEALTLFNEQSQAYFRILTLVHLGNVELGLKNTDRAHSLHEQAKTEALALGESWVLSFALNNLGEVARTLGQYDRAREYYEQCEALLRDTGDQGDIARFVHNLGYIAQHGGDYAHAESQFRRSLKMFRRLGNRRGIAECLVALAGLKARQGDLQAGAIMISAGESLLLSTGGGWWPADRMEVEQNHQLIEAALSPEEFADAWKQGASMTIDQAISFASNES